MPDAAVITAALSSLRTATEIVKLIRESGTSLQTAELKLRLADLLTSVAEARTQLVEVQELLATKDAKIAELELAFAAKDSLKRHNDAYYRLNAAGDPEGEPLCVRCWEVDHRQHQLVRLAIDHRIRTCPACNAKYEGRLAGYISPKPGPGS